MPSGFQERIRASFPYYEAKPSLKLPAGLPPDVVSSLIQGTPLGLGPTHEFSSADKQWGERSEKIGALERGFSSPTRPLIIVVFRHSRHKGNDHAQSANPANGDIQRRPHSNRGIASRRSGPRSRTSSSRSKPNAAIGA